MSNIKVYLASPIFNADELSFVEQAEKILFARGFDVFSPRLNEVDVPAEDIARWSRETYLNDLRGLDGADVVVMLYHGAYSDSGTAWEAGYACGKGKPVIAVHVLTEDSNLMVHESARANITLDELEDYDFEALPPKAYEGNIY